MTSHSKQEHPFMKHKATFYILVVLVSKYNFNLLILMSMTSNIAVRSKLQMI